MIRLILLFALGKFSLLFNYLLLSENLEPCALEYIKGIFYLTCLYHFFVTTIHLMIKPNRITSKANLYYVGIGLLFFMTNIMSALLLIIYLGTSSICKCEYRSCLYYKNFSYLGPGMFIIFLMISEIILSYLYTKEYKDNVIINNQNDDY